MRCSSNVYDPVPEQSSKKPTIAQPHSAQPYEAKQSLKKGQKQKPSNTIQHSPQQHGTTRNLNTTQHSARWMQYMMPHNSTTCNIKTSSHNTEQHKLMEQYITVGSATTFCPHPQSKPQTQFSPAEPSTTTFSIVQIQQHITPHFI